MGSADDALSSDVVLYEPQEQLLPYRLTRAAGLTYLALGAVFAVSVAYSRGGSGLSTGAAFGAVVAGSNVIWGALYLRGSGDLLRDPQSAARRGRRTTIYAVVSLFLVLGGVAIGNVIGFLAGWLANRRATRALNLLRPCPECHMALGRNSRLCLDCGSPVFFTWGSPSSTIEPALPADVVQQLDAAREAHLREDYTGALSGYLAAEGTLQIATQNDPRFRFSLARVKEAAGKLYSDRLNDYQRGVTEYHAALPVIRELASQHASLRVDLVASLDAMGHTLSFLGDNDNSVLACREAESLCRQIVRERVAYTPLLARVLATLGDCLGQSGQRSDALSALGEAERIYRQLTRSNRNFALQLTATRFSLAGESSMAQHPG